MSRPRLDGEGAKNVQKDEDKHIHSITMEEIFSIIFGRFLSRQIGGNVRFLFLRMFNPKVKYSEVMNEEKEFSFTDDFSNLIVGIVCMIVIMFLFGALL